MLELRNIHKRFGDKQILSDFNLTIHEGKILAIVGPSGGGKTTLLRMLAGLETIDSGEVFFRWTGGGDQFEPACGADLSHFRSATADHCCAVRSGKSKK